MRCFIFLSSSMLGFFFGKKEEQQQHEKSDCKRSVCRSILLYSPTKMTKSRNTATNVRLNRKFAAKSHVNMYFDLFLWRLFLPSTFSIIRSHWLYLFLLVLLLVFFSFHFHNSDLYWLVLFCFEKKTPIIQNNVLWNSQLYVATCRRKNK